ncbi:MAG: helix-turn-helix domain-containing protein [Firmicutes bacterium]|nr:helix-turn-helix domain-containing protein [Bacillota bacterium]
MDKKSIVNIENKFTLTVKEAAEYFNIGENRIREMSDQNDCPFVLWVGSKRLIKRKKFEDHLNGQYSI